MFLHNLIRQFLKCPKRLPLRLILIVPFVLQIIGAVGLTGYLSFHNGQRAVNNLTTQWQIEVSDRIRQHLHSYLETSHLIENILANAVRQGQLQTQEQSSERYLVSMLKLLPSVNAIRYGNQQGEYIGTRYLEDGRLVISVSNSNSTNNLRTYTVDPQGNRVQFLNEMPNYDPRLHPWYRNARQNRKTTWSPTHIIFSQSQLGLTLSQPVYDDKGTILGVVGIDILLSEISKFLQSLNSTKTGQAFILERSGLLIASSTQQPTFTLNQGKAQRLLAANSQDPLIQLAAQQLTQRFGNLNQINSHQQLTFKFNGERYYLQISPLQEGRSLNWLIGVVVPESDFMNQINANNRTTIILCLGALIVAIILGIFTSNRIAKPLIRLSAASRRLARQADLGNLTGREFERSAKAKGVIELEILADSFQQMLNHLQTSFETLDRMNEELERRVEQRTAEIRLSEEKFILVFRYSSSPIIISTLEEGRLIEVNDSFLNITGYSQNEVIGHTIRDLNLWVNPENREQIIQILQSQGVVRDQEFNFHIKSGQVRTGLFSAEIINIDGQKCLLSIINDITENKKAREALFESQRALLTLMSNLPGMAYRMLNDPDWTCQFVNEGCYELTGYPVEDLIDNRPISYRQLIHPKDQALVQREILSAIIESRSFQIIYRIITATGELKWVWEQGRGIFSPEGDLIAIEGFISDITARQQAEEKVELLLAISQAISSAPDFQTALAVAINQMCEITGWVYGEVWVPAADGTALECSRRWYRQRTGIDPSLASALDKFREYSEILTFLPNEELPGRAWYRGKLEWISDLSTQPDDVLLRLKLAQECGLKSALSIPIIASDGIETQIEFKGESVLAVLIFFMLDGHQHNEYLIELISVVSAQLGTVLKQKKSEAEIRALFTAMRDIVLVLDASGRCLKVAPTNPVSLYKPPAELLGTKLHDWMPSTKANHLMRNIREVLLTQQTVNVEHSLPIGEQEVWLALSLSPLSEESVICVARDITESKLLEDKLRTSEKKMRVFFEAMTDIILVLDVQDNMIVNIEIAPTNPSRLYELAIDPIGQTIEQFFGGEKTEDWLIKIQQALSTQRTLKFDYNLMMGDNEVWFAASISPISEHSIIWVARDITDRKQAEEALRLEQDKSERLLLNILPEIIAQRLKQDQRAIAEHFDDVTILFADIVGFTPLSARLKPIDLVNLLNHIFSQFDQLAQQYGLEKIKTIGDAYMVVGGLPVTKENHAEAIAQMALDMQQAILQFQAQTQESFQIRIGINTGPVIAGVIGMNKFIYDLWGDAVNVASRMESSGVPGRIQVTAQTYERLREQFEFEERGAIAVKGKGKMTTYWLLGRKTSEVMSVLG
jgi:PAS domain S-box-containing protein